MRIILFTGKGGAGKTSVAAASAIKCADEGKKTLLLSTSEAHDMEVLLKSRLSSTPLEIVNNLWTFEINRINETENIWLIIQEYIKQLFSNEAIASITAKEFMGFPGIDKLLFFTKIMSYYKNGEFDVIIIDCEGYSEAAALLSYPEILRWWIDKLLPMESKTIKLLKPVSTMLGMKLPFNEIVEKLKTLHFQLGEIIEVLTDRDTTSVRLVLNLNKINLEAAKKVYMQLCMYDYNVDAIIINKALIKELNMDNDKAAESFWNTQQEYLSLADKSFGMLPRYILPLFSKEIAGIDELSQMGNMMFAEEASSEVKYKSNKQKLESTCSGYKLAINLPNIDIQQLFLNYKNRDIIIQIGTAKRVITIPEEFGDLQITGARFKGEILEITLI